MLSESEIDKRFPVWNALSDLFLDTELDAITYRYIAKVVVESGYEPQEIHDILWKEVLPAVGDNLRIVAGEWAGFNPEWLKERILSVMSQDSFTMTDWGLISVDSLIDMTKQEWAKVCCHMPSSISEPLLEACGEISANKKRESRTWWRLW
ncbi:hypothetical protein C0J08_14065 [Marinomonas sp. CT5]|uniref:DUF7079 family protein n=1 Tax=Marinomonas sp. CT5 TaxID=2066133 RepID=UPI0017B8F7F0|nr:hypothetical protein [Marinomonas sp. CT5]NVK74164.1 hypothetical protein [Oceanospirillaceae bacterium]QUX96455.1 hypothetical protein C0J08_14065 [Marinomonas sp. CT5]